MIKDLVLKNRSYRKFHNDKKVSVDTLKEFIDIARTTPSSKNRQPLKYILVTNYEDNEFVFSQLKWAWYLKDWDGPSKDEQPPSYIIMCIDTNLNDNAMIDAGIAAQTILLGAVENQLGGCIIRTVNRYAISKYFNLSENLEIVQVLAIGYPNQEIELTDVKDDESINYFEDLNGKHFVPKRKLEDLIIIPNKTSPNK